MICFYEFISNKNAVLVSGEVSERYSWDPVIGTMYRPATPREVTVVDGV